MAPDRLDEQESLALSRHLGGPRLHVRMDARGCGLRARDSSDRRGLHRCDVGSEPGPRQVQGRSRSLCGPTARVFSAQWQRNGPTCRNLGLTARTLRREWRLGPRAGVALQPAGCGVTAPRRRRGAEPAEALPRPTPTCGAVRAWPWPRPPHPRWRPLRRRPRRLSSLRPWTWPSRVPWPSPPSRPSPPWRPSRRGPLGPPRQTPAHRRPPRSARSSPTSRTLRARPSGR